MAPNIINYNQSRVKQFRRCQRQYAFRYDTRPGLELIPKRKKLPLYRGSWMHALQQALHYQWAGLDQFTIKFGDADFDVSSWQELQEDLTDEFDKLFDEEKDELGELDEECERLFKSYLRFWKDDQKKYTVAIIDDKPAIELIVSVPISQVSNAAFKGMIDLVVEDQEYGGLWIWDAKWVKTIPAPDERMMSPQALLYVWALRKMGYDIRGFIFNYGRTKAPAVPYTLKRNSSRGPAGSVTMRQRLDTDLRTYVQAIKEAHGREWKDWVPYYKPKLDQLRGREGLWFRRERIPVEDERILRGVREYYATIKDIQRRDRKNPPRSYFFNCKFSCDYHDLCVAEFTGLDIQPLIKASYQYEGERYGEEDLLEA